MKFVYFVLYFCFSFKLLAFSLPTRFSELNLTKHAYIYLDKKNELSIEKILNEPSAYPFQKSQHESPSLGYLNYPVWLKVTLSQSHYEKAKYIIDIPSSALDHIHVFEWNEKTKKLKTLEMGDQLPFWSRPIEHTTFAFFLELEKDTETTLFFRFQSDSSLTLPIKIYEEESFHIQANRYKFIFGMYYGFILGLILYNLFLAFQIFEASYFFYVGYMTSLVLLMSTGVGHSFEYLWQNATEWNSRAFSFFNGVVVFFSPLFAKAFLRIDLRKGFVNWLLLITAGIGLGFSLYSTYGNILLTNKAVNTLSLFGTLILGIAGISSLKHEPRLAKLFLLAWGVFLFFSFFVILRLLGFLPRNTVTYYGAQIGSVFEALLLSFALADRIKQLEKAREEAVEQKLKLQIQVKENLEYEIRKRSEELQKYTLKLQKDLSMAKKIQSKIFPSGNFYINKFFVSVIYHPKDSVGGDFYNIHSFSQNRLRVFLADATGHGVQAALVTMTIKSEYDSLKEIILEPSELLENLYQRFFDIYEGLNLYFTSFLADIDIETKKMTYASVGHPNQYIIQNNEIIELPRTASLFAVITEKTIGNKTLDISVGDKLTTFTDGIFEEFDKQQEQYGEARLKRKLLSLANESPSEICRQIFEDVQMYAEPTKLLDDITMIVIQIDSI